jgi:tetratricopeptide (TPR) repeat protein
MRFATALMTALLLHAHAAHADKALAKEHYTKGMAAYTLDNYDKAIEEFRAGFEEAPDPVFLFNIAQAYRLSHRPREAISFYKKYLQLAPTAKNRDTVEQQIQTLEKSLGEPEGTIPPTGPEAAGTPTKRESPTPAGTPHPSHTPAAAADKTVPTSRQPAAPPPVRTASGAHPPSTAVPAAALSSSEPPKTAAPRKRRWPIWVGVAAGAVAAGAGVGLGVGLTQSTTPTLPLINAR